MKRTEADLIKTYEQGGIIKAYFDGEVVFVEMDQRVWDGFEYRDKKEVLLAVHAYYGKYKTYIVKMGGAVIPSNMWAVATRNCKSKIYR